jgi:hypothetical protein
MAGRGTLGATTEERVLLTLFCAWAMSAPSDSYHPDNLVEGTVAHVGLPNVDHVWIEPAEPTREQLVVYLSGSRGDPSTQRWVLRGAATMGFRTLGLSYDTKNGGAEPTPSDVCLDLGLGTSLAVACASEVRLDHILGGNRLLEMADTHRPGGLDGVLGDPDLPSLPYGRGGIGRQGSVIGELVHALEELEAIDPWYSRFLSPGRVAGAAVPEDVVWDDIILSGFSQGAGHAQLMATLWEVHGVVAFSGPFDSLLEQPPLPGQWGIVGPALWLEAGATPGERRYHLHHLNEGGGAWSATPAIPSNLDELEVPDIQGFRPEDLSYSTIEGLGAHRFGTDMSPICDEPSSFHKTVAVDDCLPMFVDLRLVSMEVFLLPRLFNTYAHMFDRAGG